MSGSPITEAIAAHALNNADAMLARLASTASANLSVLDGVMARSAGILSWVRPQGGTIAYPWFVDGRDSRPFCEYLAEAGVLVVPGDCFRAPEHMRIGLGVLSHGFERAAEILEDLLLGDSGQRPASGFG